MKSGSTTSAPSSSRCAARSPRSSSCSRSRSPDAGSVSAPRRCAGAAASASSRRSVYPGSQRSGLLAPTAQRNEGRDPHRAITQKLGGTVLFHILRASATLHVPASRRRSGACCHECRWEVDCASTSPSPSSSPSAFPQTSASPSSLSHTGAQVMSRRHGEVR